MNKIAYIAPSANVVDIHLESGVMTGSIKTTQTPSGFPDLEVSDETTTSADSRRKDIWTDPEEEEEEQY